MNYFKITFPDKTAKEIVDECGNKACKGKLLYDISWYKDEDFYTKEKCRAGTREVSIDLIGKGETWNDSKKLVEKEDGEMLNMAEMIWFAKTYLEETGKYLFDGDFSWTSSISSGGSLLRFGYFGSDGAHLHGNRPGRDWTILGSVFSRRIEKAPSTFAECPHCGEKVEVCLIKVI
jgi:hypothetical protein